METRTTWVINRIRFLMSEGMSMRAAARTVVTEDRATALDVMETIGNWPSSEPELRALQSAFGSTTLELRTNTMRDINTALVAEQSKVERLREAAHVLERRLRNGDLCDGDVEDFFAALEGGGE